MLKVVGRKPEKVVIIRSDLGIRMTKPCTNLIDTGGL